ncbi:hypothetical protein BAU06_07785 [Bordetella bronchialis]|uniref:Lipoprotein n=1 Tax=Bordetella bronchialis TaxID=463025 RepID=A0ABN4R1Q2_9BORD|nr:hypothetical protein BAU06_07785 [Bordetella bronchialis]
MRAESFQQGGFHRALPAVLAACIGISRTAGPDWSEPRNSVFPVNVAESSQCRLVEAAVF